MHEPNNHYRSNAQTPKTRNNKPQILSSVSLCAFLSLWFKLKDKANLKPISNV